ncbi:MAG: tetratricopeptide repeat protein [Opitutaceae bacterium]|nr:tetratricopeptide repeat protein [Opitutaceae bacterium]NBR58643.1 tetratricopeptide repeat protein [Opitutaceae bacterium]
MSALPPRDYFSVKKPPIALVATLLMGFGLIAYWPSFRAPFLFDDLPTILENSTLRSLLTAWSPPANVTTSGRPLLNLSLALNYAWSGEHVWSYHVTNLTIHLLAGLVLFGLVRRTLLQPKLGIKWQAAALPLAALVAAIWLLHPLQTESVTYIVQRAESQSGLCYLCTLYAFVRGAAASESKGWYFLTVISCLAGMASKEVMVSAPLMVLLYDGTLVANTWEEIWRKRRWLYGSLAATWLPLIWLIAGTEGRGGSAGFTTEISVWHYALTQCHAVVHYLFLVGWPQTLIFDYGTAVIENMGSVWWQGLLLLGLGLGTVIAIKRRLVWGLLGFWFFAILAPSSSLVPVATQTMAEHRMYLPLVAPIVIFVLALYEGLGRRSFWLGLLIILILGGLTFRRNADYQSAVSLWEDTVAKNPSNPRAHYNLSIELTAVGRKEEARAQLEETLRLAPNDTEAHLNLGNALALAGQPAEALHHYEQAVKSQPASPEAQLNLGYALAHANQLAKALEHYSEALRLRPEYAEAHNDLGEALAQAGRLAEAMPHFMAALRIRPNYAEAHNNLAGGLLQNGQKIEAIAHFKEALRYKPELVEAHSNLAYVLLQEGQKSAAVFHYHEVLRLEPNNGTAQSNLGYIAWQEGRLHEAVIYYEAALRCEPDNQSAQSALRELRKTHPP